MGSKKVSELNPIQNSEIESSDLLVLVDTSDNETKKFSIEELDKRYLNVGTEISNVFDSLFAQKDTSALKEGNNLYYTHERFLESLDVISSDSLNEGQTNLFYTEERVKNNSDVAANTQKRHEKVTLANGTTSLELNESSQVLTTKKSGTTQDGFLSKEDFILFSNKANKNTEDIDSEKTFSFAENIVTPTDVTNFKFNETKVRAFRALVSVFVDEETDIVELIELRGAWDGQAWTMTQTQLIGGDSKLDFSIVSSSGFGQVQYVSGLYNSFVSGKICFRALTLGV